MTKPGSSWSEEDSTLYRELAQVAVPRREEQIAAVLTLVPLSGRHAARVVELGCGTGSLSFALLEAFPECHLTALDGSDSMLAHCEDRLSKFRPRARLERFELDASDWLHHLDGANAVVASLSVHHLDRDQKKTLFREVGARVAAEGAFLLADLIAPSRYEAVHWFRESWDHSARDRAETLGRPELWSRFENEEWNYYRHPDPADKPSPLFDQLRWLAESRFVVVDCFWMLAGHAVYGGYRSHNVAANTGSPLAYADALDLARRAIEATS